VDVTRAFRLGVRSEIVLSFLLWSAVFGAFYSTRLLILLPSRRLLRRLDALRILKFQTSLFAATLRGRALGVL
jgi:hypothetical protein